MRKYIYTSVVNFALAAGRTARATWRCHYVYMCANNFTLTTNYYTCTGHVHIYISCANLLYIASRQFRPGGRPHGTRVTWRRHYIHKYTCMQHFTVTTTRAPGVYICVCDAHICYTCYIRAHSSGSRGGSCGGLHIGPIRRGDNALAI